MAAFKKGSAYALDRARTQLAETNLRLSDLAQQREARLIAGDPAPEIAKIDAEIEAARHAARTEQDRIRLLEQQAEREKAERQRKEQQALIERIERKLEARERAAAELADMLPTLNKHFRRLLELGREIDAAWPWPGSDRLSIMIPRETIGLALQHELYRVTANPARGGGRAPTADSDGSRFPGAKPPDLMLYHQPHAIRAFTDVIKDANAYASDVMRGKRVPGPQPEGNGAALPERKRTQAEIHLTDLLKRQAELAAIDLPTPEQDREYSELIAEISKASTAAEMERQPNG